MYILRLLFFATTKFGDFVQVRISDNYLFFSDFKSFYWTFVTWILHIQAHN